MKTSHLWNDRLVLLLLLLFFFSDFNVLQDDKYGNCYTFNNKESKINASKTGSRYGEL